MKENLLQNNIKKIVKKSPLVHNITNYVVMNNTANALLALGASPVMSHALEEVEEMASIASSLVLNIGTLSNKWIEAMLKAGKIAKAKNIPIIFDPVGVGATSYRNETAAKILLEVKPDIIRGNASEIMALAGKVASTKGVDSKNTTQDAQEIAKNLAKNQNCIVVVSGEQDYISNGENDFYCNEGDILMSKITGMGCTLSAIIGAFAGVEKNYFEAGICGTILMGKVGKFVAREVNKPGTFQVAFIDALYLSSQGKLIFDEK